MTAGGSPRRVELRIGSRLEHVQLMAHALQSLCMESGLDARTSALVELALVEAINNVIRHAYGLEPDHTVEVGFECSADRLRFEVSDTGRSYAGALSPRFEFDPADTANLPEGGMGLHLIESIMDDVDYRSKDGRNTLIMTKRIAD